jgi:hypothetical protein
MVGERLIVEFREPAQAVGIWHQHHLSSRA